jgi:hypothetical protein
MKSTTLTSKLSGPLHQQVNLHAVAIITAVVSMITLSQPSDAKVVYSPANVLIRDRTYNLDLNNHGIADFGISESEVHKGCQGSNYYGNTLLLNVTPTLGNRVVGSGGLAAALNLGAPIGPHSTYSETRLLMESVKKGFFLSQGKCQVQDTRIGNWLNVTDRYLGLKFLIHGKLHFGWARLNVQLDCGGTYCFLIVNLTGYAYETIPGKSIKAGQTKSAEDEPILNPDDSGPGASLTNPIPNEPQPASLGMLALGAQGLPLWRRKESSVDAPN